MGHLLVISDWGHKCSALSFKVAGDRGYSDGKVQEFVQRLGKKETLPNGDYTFFLLIVLESIDLSRLCGPQLIVLTSHMQLLNT